MRFGLGRSSVDVVSDYIAAVNAHDLATVENLFSDNIRLIDSSGNEVSGKVACMDLIRKFSAMAPDFRINIHDFSRTGDDVLMRGNVESSDLRLATSTHFRARAEGGKLLEWEASSARPGGVIDYVLGRDTPNAAAA